MTAPTLPAGVTITLDLGMSSWLSYYPTTLSPVPLYNNIATIEITFFGEQGKIMYPQIRCRGSGTFNPSITLIGGRWLFSKLT